MFKGSSNILYYGLRGRVRRGQLMVFRKLIIYGARLIIANRVLTLYDFPCYCIVVIIIILITTWPASCFNLLFDAISKFSSGVIRTGRVHLPKYGHKRPPIKLPICIY